MTTTLLRHSDQIVTAIAKMPTSVFGTYSAKEVMLYLADHMNKAKGWVAWPAVPTIAKAVGFCDRTVRYSLRRLEELNFINTEEEFRKDDPRMNTANRYKLGSALRTLCEQVCRVASKPLQPNKSHLNKDLKDKDNARSSFFFNQNKKAKQKSSPMPLNVPMTPVQAIEAARESALRGIEKMRSMLPPALWTVPQYELTSQGATV